MHQAAVASQDGNDIQPGTLAFYRNVLETLNAHSLPYLVGGAYAFNHYTGINRHTEDFDLFICRNDYDRIREALVNAGYDTELTYPHWLAKTRCDGDVIDLIFSSGNGVAAVDDAWFTHAVPATLFGIETKLCPAEETIWSKAFVMERERFDGADVAHLILARGQQLDWGRLIRRFDAHWRLLLSHLILFGFIYPTHREVIPTWVMEALLSRLDGELHTPASASTEASRVCGGTLLSREQYLNDVTERHYKDARVTPHGNMTEKDTVKWTEAIKK